ncbi:hypothetical protein ACPA9J_03520 [Pseudomonas aeruginosa]
MPEYLQTVDLVVTAHLHETGTGTGTGEDGVNTLQAWRTGIDTHQEPVVYMRRDCPVCQSEGFTTQARVQLSGRPPQHRGDAQRRRWGLAGRERRWPVRDRHGRRWGRSRASWSR